MSNPFDQFNDPRFQDALRQLREMQDNPAYQSYMNYLERRQNDPFYDQGVRDLEKLQSDPRYQAMREELERQQNDPGYKAKLDFLRDERQSDFSRLLNDFPDMSQMQDLLKATSTSMSLEFDNFISQLRGEQIQILLDAKKLQDNADILRTFEEIRRADELFDNHLDYENILRREEIHFNPPTDTETEETAMPAVKEHISAEFFLLDLQAKYTELYDELADNEQLSLFAVFSGFTIKVSSCVADTFNRIRINGRLGENEAVIFVSQSDFTVMFIKEVVEPETPRRKIGFIIEDEIVDNEAEDDKDEY